MMDYGFPRLYEDGTITVCKAIKGVKRRKIDSKTMTKLGKRKKSFELTSRKKRLIRCSAIRQYLSKKKQCNVLYVDLSWEGITEICE